MPSTVTSYQQGAFVTPINGASLDATVVLGNDNNLRLKFNSHDADPAIHVQSSVLASRPAAGTAGRFWVTSDGKRAYLDSGASWGELAYLPSVGGTVTGAITQSGGTVVRFENTGGPTTGTGVGVEIGVPAGIGTVQAYNQTTAAYAPLQFLASSHAFAAPVVVNTLFTNGLYRANNGVTIGAGTITLSTMGGGTGIMSAGAVDSGGAGFRLLRVPN